MESAISGLPDESSAPEPMARRHTGRILCTIVAPTCLLEPHGDMAFHSEDAAPVKAERTLLHVGRETTAVQQLIKRTFAHPAPTRGQSFYSQSVDTAPLFKMRWKLRHNMTLWDAVYRKRVLIVNQGASLLEYGTPGNNEPTKVYKLFFDLWEKFDTPLLSLPSGKVNPEEK
ncbi:hypothetical protein BD414DRAFT_16371 [Trametes punicea]|nr:hypothetical protein BD414DRAFT_16371 [Trametes punicea]